MNELRSVAITADTQARLSEVLDHSSVLILCTKATRSASRDFGGEPSIVRLHKVLKERFLSANVALWTFISIAYLSEAQID